MRAVRTGAIPVDEGIIKTEFQDKLAQLGFNVRSGVFRSIVTSREHIQGVHRLFIHIEGRSAENYTTCSQRSVRIS